MEMMELVRKSNRVFDETTGNYTGTGEDEKTVVYADVSPVTVTNAQIMYGDLRKRAIICRNFYPLNWHKWDFDYLLFRGKKYTLDNDNAYGNGISSFYFSEV